MMHSQKVQLPKPSPIRLHALVEPVASLWIEGVKWAQSTKSQLFPAGGQFWWGNRLGTIEARYGGSGEGRINT